MESRLIKTPSGTIHAQLAGNGEAVLLIHGRSVDLNSWKTWEKNIDTLAEHNSVYALDLLGYGESDKPQPLLDARGQARALVQLLEAEKIEKATLIGLSWGGMIAQVVVGIAPERVSRLVLTDSGYDESEKGIARLNSIACPTLILWDEEDTVIPVKGAEFLAKSIPGAQVRILKSAERDPDADPENRHWAQMTHSRIWNPIVVEFLRRKDFNQ